MPYISTAYCKVIPICIPACNIARSLVYAMVLLLGPICPLLGFIPSIVRGTINDIDVASTIEFIMIYIPYYPQILLSLVEICS